MTNVVLGPRATARLAARKASRSSALRTVVRTVGELMITVGVIILLYCVYELFWTGVGTARAQGDLREELAERWTGPTASAPVDTLSPAPTEPAPSAGPIANGEGVAIVRIPRFGASFSWVIVEGVSKGDLRLGPGHYPDSAAPGQVGNFAVAGHRTTYGAPCSHIDALEAGDVIVDRDCRQLLHVPRGRVNRSCCRREVDVIAPCPRFGEAAERGAR